MFWLLVQAGVTVYWWSVRSRRSVKAFWIFIALLPLFEGASIWVITPREIIHKLCFQLAELVQKGNADAVASHVDDTFEAAGYDRETFTERVKTAIQRYSVTDIRLQRVEIRFPQKDRGVAWFDATCVIRSSEMQYETILSRWQLTFIRRLDRWKLTHIKALPRPLSPIRSLRQCLQ